MIRAGLSIKAVAQRMKFSIATIRGKIKADRIQELRHLGAKRKQ